MVWNYNSVWSKQFEDFSVSSFQVWQCDASVYDNGDDEIEQYDVRSQIQCSTIDVDSTYSYKGWQKWMVDYLFLISAQRITVTYYSQSISQAVLSLIHIGTDE
jgi:hypothetical protein